MKYQNTDYFGFLFIDKPKGATSHDIVAEVRYRLKCKVGHTGTLDPFATGLLIIALGNATRLAEYLQKQDKEYVVTLVLGEEKDTYDITGRTIETKDYSNITEETVKTVVQKYVGDILQAPPAYSAIKVDGKRAYELARKGEVVELKKRPVTINSIEITKLALPEIELKISCSSGTYIRSLVHDIGMDLGCFAYAKELRRTSIRDIFIKDSHTLSEFFNLSEEEVRAAVIHPVQMLEFMPKVILDDFRFEEVKNGCQFDLPEGTEPFETGLAIFNDELVALIKVVEENGKQKAQPEKVFITANS